MLTILLSILVLFVAIISRLSVPDDGKLGEKTALVALEANHCYQRISDAASFPRWMVSVQSVDLNFNKSEAKVGQSFLLTTDWGWLGTMSYDAQVSKADGRQSYAFEMDHGLGNIRTEAYIIPVGEKKCRIRLSVVSLKENIFQKYFAHPFACLYYSSWLTHSLLAFQLLYS